MALATTPIPSSRDGNMSQAASNSAGPKISSVSPVVLEDQRDAAVGISVGLHPLPIMNVSEHITRTIVQTGNAASRVYGVLLGTQAGRSIEVQTTFEVLVNDEDMVNHDFLQAKAAQFKQVFPTFDFLGWYSNGQIPTQTEMDIHRQLTQYNESPLFLQVSPSAEQLSKAKESGELPIGIYETFIEVQSAASALQAQDTAGTAQDGPTMYFRPVPYSVQTGEAERIAVDHASKPTDGDGAGQSSLIASLTTQYNAIKMLSDRIDGLRAYVEGVQAGTISRDHENLRQIASLVASLPASGEVQEFKDEFMGEYNDLLLTTYLSDLTNGIHGLHELVDKFDAIQQGNELGVSAQPRARGYREGGRGGRSKGGRTGRGHAGGSGMFA